jgi:cytidylate kinase
MNNKKYTITIDGPAASGKGSLSKIVSNDLNLYYMETGIYYRIFAKNILDQGFKEDQTFKIEKYIKKDQFKLNIVNKENIYNDEVSKLASILAKKKVVRSIITNKQQRTLEDYPSTFKGILLEGRDCGTVIAPNADVKIFLTANINVRANRRFKQISHKNDTNYEDILMDLVERDKRDESRKISPLKKAEDAILLDNTHNSLEETINIVKNIIFSKLPYLKIN